MQRNFLRKPQSWSVMDAFFPAWKDGKPIYNDPNTWHFPFPQSRTPEALVSGRERIYFLVLLEITSRQTRRDPFPAADREAYIAAYSRPGRMRAGWAYFAAWPQTAKDFELARANQADNAGPGDRGRDNLWEKCSGKR